MNLPTTPHSRFHVLWAINGPLDVTRLCDQLGRFKAAGFDGVVFHPRFYPGHPPYLSADYLRIVSETILHAKSLGLAFWIYDENGWPSGTVGGEMLAKHPELSQRWAGLFRERPERCLAEFNHDGRHWYLGERTGAGVDYLNPAVAREFLALTHERYKNGLTPEAFAYVEAFFCDEPEFGLGHAYDSLPDDGAIPWTSGLAELYAEQHGEDLFPQIRDLFFTTERSAAVRVRFWELLRDRFCTAFLAPINEWCRMHGKRFTAHIKGEEHPLFQVPMVGSCSAVFRHLALPGIDTLERDPGNDFFPRQLVSSAQQFGDGRCMVEAFGGAGWGATPADLERYLLWLGGHGITDFVMHLSQYRLDSAAIRDWPPSQPLHLSWAEAYHEVIRRVKTKLAASLRREADTLVISPHRAVMQRYEPGELLQTNIHSAATYPASPAGQINRKFLAGIASLQSSGAAWHVTDEETFEAFARSGPDGVVTLGRCNYRRVFAAEGVELLASWGDLPGLPEAYVPASVPVIAAPVAVVPLAWTLVAAPSNSLLIETRAQEGGWFSATLPVLPQGVAAELFFVDELTDLTLAGGKLQYQSTADGTRVVVPAGGAGPLHFRCAPGVQAPFVWLQGRFLVLREGVDAAARFRLAPLTTGAVNVDLLAAGFPFLNEPLLVRTTFTLTEAVENVRLAGVAADAARVWIDNVDAGWIWGPDWLIGPELPAGTHTLELSLVPNAFNHYGPHHYYLGDRHVVSPDQFSGKKNFADSAHAPACTLTADWHFVPFRLPDGFTCLPQLSSHEIKPSLHSPLQLA